MAFVYPAAATGRTPRGRTLTSGRRVDALHALAESIAGTCGTRPVPVPADLAQRGAAAALARWALEALGRVDILVNGAGDFEPGTQWTIGDSEAARALLETNYWSPMALIRALVPEMRARRTGAVVNMSSLSTVTPLPLLGHYASAKAALASATTVLRMELRRSGVQVLLVFLGSVDTPLHAKASRSYGTVLRWMPLGAPERAAGAIMTALRRGNGTVSYPRAAATIRLFPAISAWISQQVIVPLLLPPSASGPLPAE
jgi:short-subunit dehydrogenase